MSKLHPIVAAIAIAALCIGASSIAQTQDADEALRRFVEHPTHCAQFFAGPAYGDTVTEQWSRDLVAALPGGLAEAPNQIERVRAACESELRARAERPAQDERSSKATR